MDRPVRQSAPNGSSISRPANRSPVVGISMVTAVAPSSSSDGPRILFRGIHSQGQPGDSLLPNCPEGAHRRQGDLGTARIPSCGTGRIPNRATASRLLTQVDAGRKPGRSPTDQVNSYDPEFRPLEPPALRDRHEDGPTAPAYRRVLHRNSSQQARAKALGASAYSPVGMLIYLLS